MPTHRIVSLALAMVVLVCTHSAHADGILTEKKPVLPAKPFALIVDEEAGKILTRAADLLEVADNKTAFALLREILDRKDDPIVMVLRSVASGEATWEYTHASVEVAELLRRYYLADFYKDSPPVDAKKLLAKARDEKLLELYAKCARCYPRSKPGNTAMRELADTLAESGDYVAASVFYSRLWEASAVGNEDDWKMPTLFHATVAFGRAGDRRRFDSTWSELRDRLVLQSLTLGSRKLNTTDEVEKELKARAHKEVEAIEVISGFGGTSRRTSQGVGGKPRLDKIIWRESTVRHSTVQDCLKKYLAQEFDDHRPALPGMFPVTGNRYSVLVVIFRSNTGVHCLQAKNGELKWETDLERGPDRMAKFAPYSWQECESWQEKAAKENRQDQLWDNFLVGSISREGKYVYFIDDLQIMSPVDRKKTDSLGRPSLQFTQDRRLSEDVGFNSLRCYDMFSGKYLWRVGGTGSRDDGPPELCNSYFLGSPLHLGGKIYVLNEKEQVIRLMCLDVENMPPRSSTPPILWQLPLGKAGTSLRFQPERRTQAAHIAFDDGILVCQTNTGAVLGVEPVSHSIVWANIYRDKEDSPPAKPDPEKPVAPSHRWKHSAPMIQDGRVIIAPPDADTLSCLSLRNGAVLWQVPKAEDDLYVAGIFADKVLVVGTKSVKAYSLADGKPAWKELATGMPSGHGTASSNVYYLPLRFAGDNAKDGKPEICAIDIVKGTVTAHYPWKADGTPGNLLFFNDMLLSQSIFDISAYALEK